MIKIFIRSWFRRKMDAHFYVSIRKLWPIVLIFLQTVAYADWEKLMTVETTTVYVDIS
jgi:hypothetical protein